MVFSYKYCQDSVISPRNLVLKHFIAYKWNNSCLKIYTTQGGPISASLWWQIMGLPGQNLSIQLSMPSGGRWKCNVGPTLGFFSLLGVFSMLGQHCFANVGTTWIVWCCTNIGRSRGVSQTLVQPKLPNVVPTVAVQCWPNVEILPATVPTIANVGPTYPC